ncbi:hypothetical protein ACTFIY_002712, partial [Dictyostelium cf. discoideum]
EKKIIHIQDL